MIRFFFAFCVFMIWFFLGMRYYQCNVKRLCNSVKVEHKIVETDTIPTATAFGFIISKNVAKISAVKSIDSIYKHHFDYLNTHQDQELVLTAFYTPSENDSIGLARAHFIKQQLVTYGSNPYRIEIQSVMKVFKYDIAQQYAYGFDFVYRKMSEEKLRELDKEIINKVLYAGFASKTFKPDNTLHTYAKELKNYLERHPTKMVAIIGHTDNLGDAIANEWYGKERAKNVMEYFVLHGIDASKLNISSKGESDPIATNATEEGRSLNRRIEINVTN